jgi:hypothetical protein
MPIADGSATLHGEKPNNEDYHIIIIPKEGVKFEKDPFTEDLVSIIKKNIALKRPKCIERDPNGINIKLYGHMPEDTDVTVFTVQGALDEAGLDSEQYNVSIQDMNEEL